MITVNDNFQNNSPKSLDNKYLKFGMFVYASITEANETIPTAYRHIGLTVLIDMSGVPTEFWYKSGTADIDLILKEYETVEVVNLGSTGEGLFASKVGNTLNFKRLEAGANITLTPFADRIVIDGASPASGEVNTASSVGLGESIYQTKVGVDIRLKSLIAGSGISIIPGADDLTIANTLAPGEVNTASNLGSGTEVFASKVGADLRFKSILVGSGLGISSTGNEITLTNTLQAGNVNEGLNVGTGLDIYKMRVADTLHFRRLLAGTGITLAYVGDNIQINSDAASSAVAINTTAPLQGGGDLTVDRTLSIDQASDTQDGYVTSEDFTRWNDFSSTFAGTKLVSGGIVWSGTGFTYDITDTVYYIEGVRYTSVATSVMLDAADSTNPRTDVIYLDASGSVGKMTGVASPSPAKPVVDPATQIELTSIQVAAGATSPTTVSDDYVYLENTEWTTSSSGSGSPNFNDATDPFSGSKCISVSSFAATAGGAHCQLIFTDSAANGTTFTALHFRIRLSATLANSVRIGVTLYDGTSVVSNNISIANNQYGFSRNTVGTYQLITIPSGAFIFTGSSFDKLVLTLYATGSVSIPSTRWDNISFQDGVTFSPSISTGVITFNSRNGNVQPQASDYSSFYIDEPAVAGSNGDVLTLSGGLPTWSTPATDVTFANTDLTATGNRAHNFGSHSLNFYGTNGSSQDYSVYWTPSAGLSSTHWLDVSTSQYGEHKVTGGTISGKVTGAAGTTDSSQNQDTIAFSASSPIATDIKTYYQQSPVSITIGKSNISGSTPEDLILYLKQVPSGTTSKILYYDDSNGLVYQGAVPGSVAISSLTPATATNTIDNGSYQQEWKWDTLGSTSYTGLKLSSASPNGAGSSILQVNFTGTNSVAGQSSYGIQSYNTRNGDTSTNYGLYGYAANGTSDNIGVYGIGSTTGVLGSGQSSGIGVKGITVSAQPAIYGFNIGTGYGGLFQSSSTSAAIAGQRTDSTNSTVVEALRLERLTSSGGNGQIGLGGSIAYYLESSTAATQLAGQLKYNWTTATDASRTSSFILSTVLSGTEGDRVTVSGVGALRLHGYGSGTFTGTATYTLQVDSSGNIIEGAATPATPTLQQVITAGAALTSTSSITGAASTYISYIGSQASQPLLYVVNNGAAGSAISGTTNGGSGIGVNGQSGSGYGVFATSASGTGAVLTSNSGKGASIQSNPATTNTYHTVLDILRQTSGTAADGIGGSIDFWIETDNFATRQASLIKTKWTTAADATRTSAFEIDLYNSAVVGTKLSLSGSGALKLNSYGAGIFTGTAAYNLGVDASGNVVEVAASATPTLQQVITAGSSLTSTNTITVASGEVLNITGSTNYATDEEGTVRIISTSTNGNGLYVKNTSSSEAAISADGGTIGTRSNGVFGVLAYGSSAGLSGSTDSGTGVQAQTNSGYGLYASASSGLAILANIEPSSTNSVATIADFRRGTSGTAAAGIGGSIDTWVESALNAPVVSSRVVTSLTDVTNGAETSTIGLHTKNAGVMTEKLLVSGNGALKLNAYGAGARTGTAAYNLAVDSSGNVIEVSTSGTNIYNTDGTLTGNRIVTTTGNTLTFSGGSFKLEANATAAASSTILAQLYQKNGGFTPTGGFGPSLNFYGDTNGGTERLMGSIKSRWSGISGGATDATRTTSFDFYGVRNGATEASMMTLSFPSTSGAAELSMVGNGANIKTTRVEANSGSSDLELYNTTGSGISTWTNGNGGYGIHLNEFTVSAATTKTSLLISSTTTISGNTTVARATIRIQPTFNLTGGTATGTSQGLLIAPNFTSLSSVVFRGVDISFDQSGTYGIYQSGTSVKNIFAGATSFGTTSDPATSALVELNSTTKGLLLPRMTKTQRDAISSPVAGLAVYQTDNTPGLRVHNGTNWMKYTESTD